MATISVLFHVKKNEDLKRRKIVWRTHWQLIAEYIMTRKADFNVTRHPGEFLNKDLFDSTAVKANRIRSSSLLGTLWPDGSNSFRFRTPENIKETREVKDYYNFAHERLGMAMDDPEATLAVTLEEYMLDQGAFGTSGIAVFKNELGDSDLLYRPWDIKRMSIDEGADGRIDTIYFEIKKTIKQAVETYGLEHLSETSQHLFANEKELDTINILRVIEPRNHRDVHKQGNMDMPIVSLHIELGANHLIKESGFEEMPISVARSTKHIDEVYGRSAGMDALPDILELNAIREAEIMAIEKILDPPLGILDDGKLGSATLDTSAGAVSVFNVSGRLANTTPVFPLFTVGDIRPTLERIEELKQSVNDHFSIDRLLDFNTEKEMTLGETQIRNKLRGLSLNSLFVRQIDETFTPLIKRSFNLMLRSGKLGVIRGSEEENAVLLAGEEPRYIPDVIARAMVKGEDVFKIEYLTPAQRMVQAEEAQGILQTWQFANETAAARPEVYDNLDEDQSVRRIAVITGAPDVILRDKKTVDMIRQERVEAQKEQEEQAQLAEAGKVIKDLNSGGIQK